MRGAAGIPPPAAPSAHAFRLYAIASAICVWTASAPAQEITDVALFARAAHPGEVLRLDVGCECVAAPLAQGFGVEIPLSPAGDGRWQGLVGIDLEMPAGSQRLRVLGPGGQTVHEVALEIQPKQFPTRTLRVAPRYVEPPAEETARITREAAMLDSLYRTQSPRAWTGPFLMPVTAPPTSNFGARSVFNGQPRSPHAGVDFGSPSGTAVRAPAGGTVLLTADLFFTGNTVVLDHGAGVLSVFAHLSSIAVQEGQPVAAGAALGRVGATGRATGPHLHWSVRLHGSRVDPLSLVTATQTDLPPMLSAAPLPGGSRWGQVVN